MGEAAHTVTINRGEEVLTMQEGKVERLECSTSCLYRNRTQPTTGCSGSRRRSCRPRARLVNFSRLVNGDPLLFTRELRPRRLGRLHAARLPQPLAQSLEHLFI